MPDGRTRTRPEAPRRGTRRGDRPLEGRIALPLVLVTRRHRTLLLRQHRDLGGELGQARRPGGHHPQDLERGHDPVARRGVLEDDHVAALLATQDGARHLHPLEDVLVADRRPDDLAAGRLDDGLEPAVGEDRDHQPATRQVVPAQPVEGQDPEHLVAVHHAPGGVHRDQPVGVAIEREPGIGAARRRPPRPAMPARSPPTRR